MYTAVRTPTSTTGHQVFVGLGVLLLVIYMYCQTTSFLFVSDCDGSFLMYRAAELGFVSDAYAKAHPIDVVLFRRDANGQWEYRAPLTTLGYAAIPGLAAHRTYKPARSLQYARSKRQLWMQAERESLTLFFARRLLGACMSPHAAPGIAGGTLKLCSNLPMLDSGSCSPANQRSASNTC